MSIKLQAIIAIFGLSLSVVHAAEAQHAGEHGGIIHKENGTVLLEDFENDKLNNHSKKDLRDYHYEVMQEDCDKFLRYEGKEAKHISLPLVNEKKENIYNINIYETPVLSWKVRAFKLPENANEKDDKVNDSVASIYVFFDLGRVALF